MKSKIEFKKTEVIMTITKLDVNDAVRNTNDSVKYNEYRKQWKEVTELNLVTEFPLQIDFELNYSCNFTCPMCTWNAESTERKKLRIIRKIYIKNVKNCFKI